MRYSVCMKQLIIIAHNLRSTHNVGSLLRTAEGLGVSEVILTGYTPYPKSLNDERLPHIQTKMTKDITKTALGAEQTQTWSRSEALNPVLEDLRGRGFIIAALEQSPNSVPLPDYSFDDNVALIVGREVEGIEPEVLADCDIHLEIPMFGSKESFNVVQAAAMAMYAWRLC